MVGAAHAATLDGHAGGVRHDRLLERDLRAVGEAGHHCGVLTPLLGKPLLRGRVPIGVVQSLDVPGDQRSQADALHEANEIHLHARLVTVASGVDDPGRSGLLREGPADGSVDLGVHQHDVLAAGDCGLADPAAVLDGPGGVDDDVDVLGGAHGGEVVGDDRSAALERCVESVAVGGDRIVDAGVGVGAQALVDRAVDDCREGHPGDRVRRSGWSSPWP